VPFDPNSLPLPAQKRIAIHVKPAAERALKQRHPWLFEGAIRKQSHDGNAGDLAVIFDEKRRFLAIGLYDPSSPIRVKVLQHHEQTTINAEFFLDRIRTTTTLRAPLLTQNTTGYRLIHGENDGLPGLIVDRYANTLVMKLYSQAWIPHLRAVIPALIATQQPEAIVLRLSRDLQQGDSSGLVDGQVIMGKLDDDTITFYENGLRFRANVLHGHKTGFFCDQRENRQRVRTLSAGRRVLDVFAYVGAFSLYAAAGGATSVTSLDISAPALALAQDHFRLNDDQPTIAQAQHKIIVDDAFDALRRLHEQDQTFDMLIIDPPSFAKRADEVARALKAYARLVEHSLPLLNDDGVFVMASCSSRISTGDFFGIIQRTAKRMGRPLHEIARTAHALDHPIRESFPEGAYLKCLFARV